MNDFNKPIRPISKKDDDKIKAEPIIEKFKEQYELKEGVIKEYYKNNFVLIYLEMMKNFFKTLFQKHLTASSKPEATDLNVALHQLKTLLEKIQNEDPTHNLKFAEELSQAWGSLLRYHQSPLADHLSIDPYKVEQLIDAINQYPSEEEHTLGFYLTRYSAEDWFPVPFFQLLHNLHEDYWNLKKNSDLDRWIALASEILAESDNH